MKRTWKVEYLLVAAVILLYLATFWNVGTELKRLDVRIMRNRQDINGLGTRVIEKWTRGDQTQWVQELGRLNPKLLVPPVPPAPGMPATPKLPSEAAKGSKTP